MKQSSSDNLDFTLLIAAGLVVVFIFLLTSVMSPAGSAPTTVISKPTSATPAVYGRSGPTLDGNMQVTMNMLNNSQLDVVAYGGSMKYNDTIEITIYKSGSPIQYYTTNAQLISSTSGVISRALVFLTPVNGTVTVYVADKTQNTYNTANFSFA